MRFAAGQRGDTAAQLQITQPNFAQEFQALANFRQNIASDHRLASGEMNRSKSSHASSTGKVAEKIDRRVLRAPPENLPALRQMQPNGPRDWIEPRPFAIGAWLAVSFLPAEP